jgi:Transcriptional regulator, AbiEi antitoxin
MAGQSSTAEELIARIAGRQLGVVTREELLAAGLTKHHVDGRVARGSLIVVYKGVYRAGHAAPSIDASYLAAVKACGPGAVLSRLAAAYVQRLVKGEQPSPEVTAPTYRRVRGVRTRRVRLRPHEKSVMRRIPITTVPRTLVDLAAVLDLDDLARAFHEAGHLYRTTPRHIDAVLAGSASPPGARNLRLVLGREALVSLSELERAFIAFLREHGLPLPRTNILVGEHRVDCHWPEYDLTVELNSYRFHQSRHSWEHDYERERDARLRDHRYRRFTYRDVFEDQGYMLRELRRLLATPRARRP